MMTVLYPSQAQIMSSPSDIRAHHWSSSHGIGDTPSAWTKNQDGWPKTLETFTADKDVIVVMPDAGQNSDAGWFTDWYNGGAYGSPRWETYHLVQLLDYVDRSFPTRGDRNGRVVAGLSMGGFGTMSYAARHPDLFAGAFSFSGALAPIKPITDLRKLVLPEPTDFLNSLTCRVARSSSSSRRLKRASRST